MKRVRIEFDKITDVPEVWLDGKKVSKGLATLKIDWNTNTVTLKPKAYKLEYFDKHSGVLKITGEANNNDSI
ncbi:hypothetical protein [Weissella paramesenteroides]|uniref:Uncharacterized protein n=1 Tax=Weissella paramesenteroides ATCC 33313 TaxID=585506 RepID=C5R816_WEIPA|nr:hypothetical protein [Weissella paramesenteroides]EER75600.1 hypothetical protein HMPREF0877_0111 [Weissella paramesenteroides ATCC 33313]